MEAITIQLRAQKFNPDEDFVALTGPAALVALFFGYLGGLRRPIKLLMYNAAQGCYQSRVLDGSQALCAPSREGG